MVRVRLAFFVVFVASLGLCSCSSAPIVLSDEEDQPANEGEGEESGGDRSDGEEDGADEASHDTPDVPDDTKNNGGASGESTPIMPMDITPTADNGDGSEPEPCSPEAALRCHGGNSRQVCANGLWVSAQPCTGSETCTGTGLCQAVDSQAVSNLCQGQAGQHVCEATGTLFSCDAEEQATMVGTCMSLTHCEQGRAQGACSQCLEGEYRCEGARLEHCDPSGAFVLDTQCDSADLCQVSAKACGTAICQADQFSCDSGMLKQCNAGGDAFLSEVPCSPDLCDEAKGLCRVCTPNRARCDGNTVMQCGADGTSEQAKPCSGEASLCEETLLGAECIGCRATSDCTAMNNPNLCQRSACNLLTHRCQTETAVGDPCKNGTNDGRCANDGHCAYCGDGKIDPGEDCDPAVTNDWHCSAECDVQGTETAFGPCTRIEDCSSEEVCLAFCMPGEILQEDPGAAYKSVFCNAQEVGSFDLLPSQQTSFYCIIPCSSSTDCPSHTQCELGENNPFGIDGLCAPPLP